MGKPRHTDRATLEFYRNEGATYRASGPGGVNRNLHRFLEILPPGGRILDLGCGGGIDSREMIRQGFDVLPVDGSAAVARKAEAVIGKPVVVRTFEELRFEGAFDAVWASASLIHVPRPSLALILGKLRHALKPGGYHFASFKGGGQDGRDADGRYYNYPSMEKLIGYYDKAGGWNLLKVEDYVGGGFEGGTTGPWLAIFAQKRG